MDRSDMWLHWERRDSRTKLSFTSNSNIKAKTHGREGKHSFLGTVWYSLATSGTETKFQEIVAVLTLKRDDWHPKPWHKKK